MVRFLLLDLQEFKGPSRLFALHRPAVSLFASTLVHIEVDGVGPLLVYRICSMLATEAPMQFLLTLPPRMAEEFAALEGRQRPEWFATSDPQGQHLGSGGGTANLL